MDLLRRTAFAVTAIIATFLFAACSGGGGGSGSAVTISATNSTIAVDVGFGTLANGVDTVTVTVTVRSTAGAAVSGQTVVLSSTGTGNTLVQPLGTTDGNGLATGTIATTNAEVKTLSAVVNPGADQVALNDTADTEFVWHLPATFFVRTTGSDANTGDSPAEAWATIGHAASLMVPGDTIYVGGGTYTESAVFTTSGTLLDPIFVIADTAGNFTSDAGEVVVDAAGGNFALHLDGVTNIGLRDFTVTGATPGANPGGGIWASGGCDSIIISGCVAYGNDRGIHVQDTTNSNVESNWVSNNTSGDGDGVFLEDSGSLTFLNNLLYNNTRYGLRMATVNVMLAQVNTLYANGDNQVHVELASVSVFENNILADGFADAFNLAAGGLILENNNVVWNHAGDDLVLGGVVGALDGSDLTLDPLLVDPNGADNLLGGAEGADDNFLVGVGSPTIDAGSEDATGITLFFEGSLTGFTTRSDGFLDGTSPDGALVNLGFHVPADTNPIGTLLPDDARLFYGRGDQVQVLGRIWDDDTQTWLPPTLSDPVQGTVKWVVNKVSPLLGQEELLAIFSDTGTGTELSVRLWNGRFWTEAGGYTDPITSQILSANANQRGFDIEYEGLSGDALVVYSDNDENPVYRSYSQGVWSPETAVFATPPGAGTVLWVDLAARPGTDEIALVTLSETNPPDEDEGDLVAVIWDGDSWDEAGSETLLDTTVTTTRASRAFDLSYETLSGDLLVAWGHTNLVEEIRFATKPAGSGVFTTALMNSAEAIGAIIRLSPDPGSDQIVCAISEGSLLPEINSVGMIWDGGAWTNIAEFDLTSAPDSRDIAVSWVGSTGVAIFLYKDDDGGGTLDWARYEGPGWLRQPDEPLAGIGDLEFIQSQSFPTQDKVMVLMSDDTGAMFALIYDGADWTITNGGVALETDLPDLGAASQPFHFALKE